MATKATYKSLTTVMREALRHCTILSGDIVGDSDKAWQDHAKVAAVYLRELADDMTKAAAGNHEPFLSFPSPQELIEEIYKHG